MNLVEILLQHAERRPSQPALIESRRGRERAVTFAELDTATARVAAMYRTSGVSPGDRLLLLTPMSIELYVALLGLWRLGATAMVLDPGPGLAHVRRCCERGRPSGLVGVPKAHLLRLLIGPLRGLRHRWVVGGPGLARLLGEAFNRYRTCSPDSQIERVADEAEALLTFTSGSTGEPKAAVRTHGFLQAQYETLRPAIALEAGQVDLATLPVFALANLASGLTTLIPDVDLRRVGSIEPGPVLRQIERHGATRCTASPAFFERLMSVGEPMPGLRRVFTGGAPVFPSLLDRLSQACPNARITALYGSTEAEPIAELDWATVGEADRQRICTGGGLPAGTPVPQVELRIIADRSGEPLPRLDDDELARMTLPSGEAGEIIVAGDHVLRGYLGGVGDERTKIHVGDRVWHRTGDAGYVDASGRLWLLGRASAKVADGWGVVYPLAVEAAVDGTAGVVRSAFVAHAGRRLLVLEAGKSSRAAIERELTDQLAWARIHRFVFMDRIPVDRRHNAKIDYPALHRRLKAVAG